MKKYLRKKLAVWGLVLSLLVLSFVPTMIFAAGSDHYDLIGGKVIVPVVTRLQMI